MARGDVRGPRCDHPPITATARHRPRRRLYRSASDKVVAGVAGGLAEHLHVDPTVVRIAFAVATFMGGVGVLAYAAFWAVVPLAPPMSSRPTPAVTTGRAPAVLLAVVAVAIASAVSSVLFDEAIAWSLVAVGLGVALIWRHADEAQRARWTSARPTTTAPRLAAGAVLLVAGGAAFLAATDELGAAREGIVAILVVVVGLAVILGPWVVRIVNELGEERRERIRSEERADLAAHVHDSVLQTLTLIQRHAADPRDVQRLARAQERELRSWLYGTPAAASGDRVAAALEAAAAEVEDLHQVRVEVVAVGDCALDDPLRALVLAAREAMVNAAKFSGEPTVSVFVEVEPERVTAFVRDTGAGFDPDAVADDRRGIAESIVGRMTRAGGKAVVRSAPGGGTEVELVVARP